MYRILYVILVVCLIQSCASNSVLTVDKINVDEVGEGAPVVDNVQFVVLHDKGNKHLSTITNMKYRKGKFYLFDYGQGLLVIYNKDGQEIGAIHQLGHAHDEYIAPLCFDVDDEGNVYISDSAMDAILVFDSNNNYKFKKRIDIGRHFMGFGVVNEHQLWISQYYRNGSNDGKLAFYDADKKKLTAVCKPVVKGEDGVPFVSNNFGIFRSDSLLYYYERFTPYAYRLNADGVCSDTLMVESTLIPSKDDVKCWLKDRGSFAKNKKIVGIQDFCVVDDNVYLALKKGGSTFLWHSSDTGNTTKYERISDSRYYYLNYHFVASTEDCLVSWCDVSTLKMRSSGHETPLVKKIIETSKKSGEASNFVLLMYRLK